MALLFPCLGRKGGCKCQVCVRWGGGLPGPDLWVVVRLVSEILMGDSLEKCRESGRCLVGVNQRSSIKMNRFIPSGVLRAFPSLTALSLSTSEELGGCSFPPRKGCTREHAFTSKRSWTVGWYQREGCVEWIVGQFYLENVENELETLMLPLTLWQGQIKTGSPLSINIKALTSA